MKSGRTNSTIRILDKIGILYVNILVIEKGSGWLFCNKPMQSFTAFSLLEELQTVSKFGSISAFWKSKTAVSFHIYIYKNFSLEKLTVF